MPFLLLASIGAAATDGPSIQLSLPLISGLVVVWMFSITTTILIVRRVQGWDKVEEIDKTVNGDPNEKQDSIVRKGHAGRLNDQEEVVKYWVGVLKAVMRGLNIPTGISDHKVLQEHVKSMVQNGELTFPGNAPKQRDSYNSDFRTEVGERVRERIDTGRHSEPGPLPPPYVKKMPPGPTRHKSGKLPNEDDEGR